MHKNNSIVGAIGTQGWRVEKTLSLFSLLVQSIAAEFQVRYYAYPDANCEQKRPDLKIKNVELH